MHYKILTLNEMKYSFTLLFVFAALMGMSQTLHQKANYDAAAKYSSERVRNMVFSTSVDPHWLKNGTQFWYSYRTSEGETYWLVDAARRTKSPLFDNVNMAAQMSRLTGDPYDAQHLGISKFEFIENQTAIRFGVKSELVEEEVKEDGDSQEKKKPGGKPKMEAKTWYFKYTLSTQRLELLSDYKAPEDDKNWARVAPNKEYVLFAKQHNLFWMSWEDYQKALKNEKDSTIVENQLTTDGEENYSYGSGRGETNVDVEKNKDKRKSPGFILFSPNSKKFALTRSDDRNVKDLWVINSVATPRPTLETYKYQMPGEKEAPIDELLVFDFDSKEKKVIDAKAFPDQAIGIYSAMTDKTTRDDDYRFSYWLSKSSDKLYFSRLSRDAKRMDLCVADVNSGEVKVLLEERLNTYIEWGMPSPIFVNNESQIVWWSQQDGWGHFYLYDLNGKMIRQITSGPFHTKSVEAFDSKTNTLYFTANGREKGEDPYYYHTYRIGIDGSGMKLLNPGNFNHDIDASNNGTYIVSNFSRVNTVPKSQLRDSKGSVIMELESADLSKLFESGYEFPEPFKVKAADGITDIYGVMYKPFDFDSTHQYPIIEYVYPGPQTEAVNKSFSASMGRTDRLAQVGFIVVTLGNRGGHPDRSKWYHNYGYGNLRDYGLADKKYGAEQLADRYSYIDINRVGIFGHSGGGFMSTAAMLVYPDFFKVAVSSSGNHDNNVYNRWWSEIHHGVDEKVNDKGEVEFIYDIDTNPELAGNLKGKLLITTGDIDNNVHPANTIRVANALIKANKRFDFFNFPGQRHGYGNMSEYFFWMQVDYFSEHLLGDYKKDTDILEMNRDTPRK